MIDQLDVQKKESSGAREAIRWLEAEFRRGNRYKQLPPHIFYVCSTSCNGSVYLRVLPLIWTPTLSKSKAWYRGIMSPFLCLLLSLSCVVAKKEHLVKINASPSTEIKQENAFHCSDSQFTGHDRGGFYV